MSTKKKIAKRETAGEPINPILLRERELKKYELEKRRPIAGGGRAMRGYGKAYLKGGRVK